MEFSWSISASKGASKVEATTPMEVSGFSADLPFSSAITRPLERKRTAARAATRLSDRTSEASSAKALRERMTICAGLKEAGRPSRAGAPARTSARRRRSSSSLALQAGQDPRCVSSSAPFTASSSPSTRRLIHFAARLQSMQPFLLPSRVPYPPQLDHRPVEPLLHRPAGKAEHPPDLVVSQSLPLPQEDHRPQLGRQAAEKLLSEFLHLQLRARRRTGGAAIEVRRDRRQALPPLALPGLQGRVDGHPVEPGQELRPPVEIRELPVHQDKYLLQDVLAQVPVPEDAQRQAEEPLPVLLDEDAERRVIPRKDPDHELLVVGRSGQERSGL